LDFVVTEQIGGQVRARMTSIVVGAALLLGAAGGCSDKTAPGTPPPSTDAAASTSTSLPGGAPHVANPLDTTKYQTDPCRALTTAQVHSLDLSDAIPKSDTANTLGPGCIWFSTRVGYGIGVSFLTSNKQGLNSLYSKRTELGVFQELPPINGYPAVIYGDADLRTQGTCAVAVGVSDNLLLDSNVQGTTKTKDPCGIAQRTAAMVIDNIKGGV
jgi:hypothetical protein